MHDQRKEALRVAARAARRTRSDDDRTRAGAAIAEVLLGELPATRFRTVACYVSTADEPPTRSLLDALRARGSVVLAPVVSADELDWAVYEGDKALVPARWGLAEPAGPRLGPAALGAADAVVVPALLVDRRGNRLGRGGGYYDRTLAHVAGGATLVAVVFDDEVVDEVPTEAHDRPVPAAATPSGIVRLGGR